MHLRLHIDGGARGNPGPAAAGVTLSDAATGKAVFEAGFFLGHTTNNVAEYQGLIRGLTAAVEFAPAKVEIYADSQLMVRQVLGQYKVKAPHLKPLVLEAKALLDTLAEWSFEHVYRDANKRADALANQAMDAQADVMPVPLSQ